MGADSPVGRRERKKRRTREQIIDAARELFVELGYEQTSIAEIAERADIAPSTFFGYFSSKSDLLFAGFDDIAADFIAAIEARPSGESAIDATIRWHSTLATHRFELGPESPEWAWARHCRSIIDGDPVLEGLEIQQWTKTLRTLADAIAQDLGDDPRDLRPRLIAATKSALYVAFFRRLASGDSDLSESVEEERYVSECLRAAADAIASVPLPHDTRRRHELHLASGNG